jgi:hypothetical protein
MKFKLPLLLLFIASLAFTSCKKGNDNPIVTPATTLFNSINASTDTINLYVNGNRLNTLTSLYPLGSTGYIATPSGLQNYQLKRYKNPAVLLNLPLQFDLNKDPLYVHSLYITDATAENTFITNDTLQTIPAESSLIRFVHTSPKSGVVDVFVGDAVNFKARAFKSVTVFLPVKAGSYRIVIKKAGTTEVLSDETRTLQAGRSYTLFTKSGLITGSTTSNTGLILNQ